MMRYSAKMVLQGPARGPDITYRFDLEGYLRDLELGFHMHNHSNLISVFSICRNHTKAPTLQQPYVNYYQQAHHKALYHP